MKFFFNDQTWRDEIDNQQYLKSLEWGMQADHLFWHVEERINEDVQTLLVDQVVEENHEMMILKRNNTDWRDELEKVCWKTMAYHLERIICDPVGVIVRDEIREKVEEQIWNDSRGTWHD